MVQKPASAPAAEHIAAAVAARACEVPLLLVSPSGAGLPPLMQIADLSASQVVSYPDRLEDEPGWDALGTELASRAREIQAAYEHARRTQYLDQITRRLSSAAVTLDHAAPSEDVALAIARIFDAQNSSITLEDHVDFLELTFPSALYSRLLNQLTNTFKSVRTIADPVAEELPWDNPVERESLATVTERIFVIDGSYARQYGIEPLLVQLALALRAARGAVSVVGLTEALRAELDQISSAEHRLKGLNRFYAGDAIVGGYADESGERVRLLAYHAAGRGAYEREALVLAKLEQERKLVPPDRGHDLTALASWVYSHVLLPEPEDKLKSIFEYNTAQYADDYDGNIVRVTPGYYAQLDLLTAEVKRAMVALYAPFSGRDRSEITMLELGFGTAALTGRVQRMSAQFFAEMRTDPARPERPFIELDGWDFLEALRTQLLAPDGIALFLDAFYTDRRHEEERAWRDYVETELGSSAPADTYLSRNPWQFRAPDTTTLQQVAESVGFTVFWRDVQPGYPFKILILVASTRGPV